MKKNRATLERLIPIGRPIICPACNADKFPSTGVPFSYKSLSKHITTSHDELHNGFKSQYGWEQEQPIEETSPYDIIITNLEKIKNVNTLYAIRQCLEACINKLIEAEREELAVRAKAIGMSIVRNENV